eukprot:2938577-Pyramimonas_sp.AAC.1
MSGAQLGPKRCPIFFVRMLLDSIMISTPQDPRRLSRTRKATPQFHKPKLVQQAQVLFEAEGPTKTWMCAQRSCSSPRVCIGVWTDTLGWNISTDKLKEVDTGIDGSVWEVALNSTNDGAQPCAE